jgi:hypothetical protein
LGLNDKIKTNKTFIKRVKKKIKNQKNKNWIWNANNKERKVVILRWGERKKKKKKPHQQQINHPALICATLKERGSGDTSKYIAEGSFLSSGRECFSYDGACYTRTNCFLFFFKFLSLLKDPIAPHSTWY